MNATATQRDLTAMPSGYVASTFPPPAVLQRSQTYPQRRPRQLISASFPPLRGKSDSAAHGAFLMLERLRSGMQFFTDETLRHFLEARSNTEVEHEPETVVPLSARYGIGASKYDEPTLQVWKAHGQVGNAALKKARSGKGGIEDAMIAVGAFRKAIALRPDFAKAYLGLALALKAAGDMSAATEALEEGLAICSSDSALTEELRRISLWVMIAPSVDSGRCESWTCCVCLDMKVSPEPVYVAVCTGSAAECTNLFCSTCLQGYFQSLLAGSSGMPALPPVRCPSPGCRRRVPTNNWTRFVPESVLHGYQKSAQDIFNFRCQQCHKTSTLFLDVQEGGISVFDIVKIVRGEHDDIPEAYIGRTGTIIFIESDSEMPFEISFGDSEATEMFARDEIEVDTVFDKGCAIRDRIGEDRWLGLKEKMLSFEAGDCEADDMVDALALAFGKSANEISGDRSDLEVARFLMLVEDVERRCVLQLACLRRNPKIMTPCCKDAYCWKCKIGSHHEGRSCEDVQRSQYDQEVQFCPGCNVATLRTEGCTEMVCVCGRTWTWEADAEAEDD